MSYQKGADNTGLWGTDASSAVHNYTPAGSVDVTFTTESAYATVGGSIT